MPFWTFSVLVFLIGLNAEFTREKVLHESNRLGFSFISLLFNDAYLNFLLRGSQSSTNDSCDILSLVLHDVDEDGDETSKEFGLKIVDWAFNDNGEADEDEGIDDELDDE